MKIFTDEMKEGVSNFFVGFHKRHENDFLCQPGIWFWVLLFIFVEAVILMFGYVGYNHIDAKWPELRGGEFGDTLVGVAGMVCLLAGWWLLLLVPVFLIILSIFMAIGSTISKKREAIKNAKLEMWEV